MNTRTRIYAANIFDPANGKFLTDDLWTYFYKNTSLESLVLECSEQHHFDTSKRSLNGSHWSVNYDGQEITITKTFRMC